MADELITDIRLLLQNPTSQQLTTAERLLLELRRLIMNEPIPVRLHYRPIQTQLQREIKNLQMQISKPALTPAQLATRQLHDTVMVDKVEEVPSWSSTFTGLVARWWRW